mmetsp:Transcript_58098/g.184820  ORF Transcript_58098/g.184820 Transcript_58098/m.184820 type:complete len:229 (+) Transcript_58098:504-1190(+)
MHCRCLISLFGFPLTTRMAPAVAQSVSDFWSSDGPWGAVESVGRRVLPDHTRAEVLSCLSFGLENRQRTSVTGPTGEEAVLLWTLQREGARWQVASIVREDPLLGEDQGEGGDAAAPHPSLPPEAVVLSQLAALKAGDFEWCVSISNHLPPLRRRPLPDVPRSYNPPVAWLVSPPPDVPRSYNPPVAWLVSPPPTCRRGSGRGSGSHQPSARPPTGALFGTRARAFSS